MNERIRELAHRAGLEWGPGGYADYSDFDHSLFAESMIAEFSDVVKSAANELAQHYTREGCSEEEVMMRVNGALVVLGHIRERFKD